MPSAPGCSANHAQVTCQPQTDVPFTHLPTFQSRRQGCRQTGIEAGMPAPPRFEARTGARAPGSGRPGPGAPPRSRHRYLWPAGRTKAGRQPLLHSSSSMADAARPPRTENSAPAASMPEACARRGSWVGRGPRVAMQAREAPVARHKRTLLMQCMREAMRS